VQLVVNAKDSPGAEAVGERLMGTPLESVVQVHGVVKERVRKGNAADEAAGKVCVRALMVRVYGY
jgi:aspartyl-tRNA synthetase